MNLINRTLNTIARIPFIKKRFPILHKGIKHYGSELSVCYAITVCDEDDELRNLLDAIIPYKSERDEILIQGDKGNTTEEVLRVIEEYKAYIKKYIEYPLNHNFGAFKSNLKNFTKCDYIFQLDADEIPSPFLMKHLHNILFDNPYDLIRLARINVMINDEEPFLLWKTYDKHGKWQTLNYPDYQRRIYKNAPSIYWIHNIHERLVGYKTVAYLPPKTKYSLLHCKHWQKQIERDEQIFDVYRKKPTQRVLIDLSVLRNYNCGLGQVAYNYGMYFKEHPNRNLNIYLLVPKQYIGAFGYSVKYITSRKIYRSMPWLMPKFDVWHSIHQLNSFPPPKSVLNLLTIHDLNFVYEKQGRKVNKYMKKILQEIRRANKITAISQYTKNDILRLIHNGLDIDVIYNGVEKLYAKDEIVPQYPVDTTKPFLFSIGEIKPKKNFHVLLDAMKLMPEYNFYLAGKDNTPYAESIKQRIEDENITNVFLTGIISQGEKIWLYNHCYAFVFPSLFEGFGLPIIEALFFKKPVISSQETSLKEIGNDAVFFLDNFSPEHITQVVKEKSAYFYKHPELAERNFEYANSFSYKKHMEKYIEIYQEMLCNARQRQN